MTNSQKLYKKVKEYLLPILLILSILMILGYYFFKLFYPDFFSLHQTGFKEVFGISLAILSSGIFLAVLKWFQFMGFFKDEINNIIESSQFNEKLQNTFHNVLYSDEFLQNRNDLESIWKKVTRCYFKSEFSAEVSDKINQKLSTVFFHNNKLSHFFRSCIITMNISLGEDDFITIEETTESKIIRHSKDKFTYDFCYYIDKTGDTDNTSEVNIHHFSVDGQQIEIDQVTNSTSINNRIMQKLTVQLEGKNEYNVDIKTRLVYNIANDNNFEHFNERVIESMRVEVNYSPKLTIYFLPIGNETFTNALLLPQRFIKVYNDLLLPEKGFRLIFVKNNSL